MSARPTAEYVPHNPAVNSLTETRKYKRKLQEAAMMPMPVEKPYKKTTPFSHGAHVFGV
ncbi:hypothetical protein SESBI_11532 [Sesbania bispinosa]|nr:hypothetical protein SESBI_11532 [Sesbania bispinosa]